MLASSYPCQTLPRVPPPPSPLHYLGPFRFSPSLSSPIFFEFEMNKVEGQARSILNDLEFGHGHILDLGHPFLNRFADGFVKAAGIGVIQAVSREAYFTAVEGGTVVDKSNGVPEIPGTKKHRFPQLRGETNGKSLEAMVKRTGKESLQWGLAAGVYSSLTYELKEARGAHDWKNSAVAGALTGVALALTADGSSHEQVVQCAITGAAVSTAANLLTGIF